MPQFPLFFEMHSVLPPGVRNPTDRTEWETEVIRRLSRDAEVTPGPFGTFWIADAVSGSDVASADPWVPVAEVSEADGEEEGAILERFTPAQSVSPADLDDFEDEGDYQGTDTIAWYWPWHLFGDDWGVYFDGPAYWRHVRRISAAIPSGKQRPSASVVERDVFAQIKAHELTHFAGEVLATQLEATHARSGYRDYLLTARSFRNPWTIGVPEEILATHNEVNAGTKGALKDAAKTVADRSPPGYAEWRKAADSRERALIEATIATCIVPDAGAEIRWPGKKAIGVRVAKSVPVYWRNGGLLVPGFLRRKVGPLTPSALRRYLKAHGFMIDRRHTRGHHEWWTRNGVVASFSVQGHDIPRKEHSKVAGSLGFPGAIDLRRAIADGTQPPAVTSAATRS